MQRQNVTQNIIKKEELTFDCRHIEVEQEDDGQEGGEQRVQEDRVDLKRNNRFGMRGTRYL